MDQNQLRNFIDQENSDEYLNFPTSSAHLPQEQSENNIFDNMMSYDNITSSTSPPPYFDNDELKFEPTLTQSMFKEEINPFNNYLQLQKELKTKTKFVRNQIFTELISDLTSLYWITLQPPTSVVEAKQQDILSDRLKQLRQEIKQVKMEVTFDLSKLFNMVESHQEVSKHLNPFLLQTFLSAETIKATQEFKTLQRRSWASSAKRRKNKDGTKPESN